MTEHTEIQSRLNDFVDGQLPPVERDEVMDHLERCGPCRDELEGLVALLAEARALPREIAPPRDLWPDIEARLGSRRAASPDEAASPPVIEVDFRAARPAWRRWAPMAAAAMVLVALSSGLTAYLMGAGEVAPVAVVPVPVPTAADTRPTSALAAFRPTE